MPSKFAPLPWHKKICEQCGMENGHMSWCPYKDVEPVEDPVALDREALLAKGGHKDDSDKVQMELIPPEMLWAVGEVLTYGAKKYRARNWEHGMKWSRPFGALMRHMWAWWRGEEKDPETGMSHLWHAGCSIAFLIAYEARGTGEDDRWKEPDDEQG